MPDLFRTPNNAAAGPVECLGLTFADDAARREHFLAILREKLQDPAFRQIEGFPIGSDEDILALSDPPYYTACPNPFIAEFIRLYGTPYDPAAPYHKEPFAADVSEGRSGIFYDAHSYHTKVPHKAIMRYILHYTQPGDLVFDGFCGTGMTGVAAQLCGDREAVKSLGYRVEKDGAILESVQEDGETVWKPFSRLGARRAILNDLSPAATFIAYNYNTPVDVAAFEREAKRILAEVEAECGWMYETRHHDGKTKGKINYVFWSDVFTCPECAGEVVFWDVAVDKNAGQMRDDFPCPHCGTMLSKDPANTESKAEKKKAPSERRPKATRIERVWITKRDYAIQQTIHQAKQTPVLINYSMGTKRFDKTPDDFDLALIKKIEEMEIPHRFPIDAIKKGDKTGEPLRIGITHIHHFYTQRNLNILSFLRHAVCKSSYPNTLHFLINSYDLTHSTLMTRVIFKSGGKKPVLTGYQSGTLYFSSIPVEKNIFEGLRKQKLGIITDSLKCIQISQIVQTGSANTLSMESDSLDMPIRLTQEDTIGSVEQCLMFARAGDGHGSPQSSAPRSSCAAR